MKKLFLLISFVLTTSLLNAQILRINLKDGSTYTFPLEKIDYLDFLEKEDDGGGEETDPSTTSKHNPEPYFSELVEMMGLLWRLAGSPDFGECQIPSIAQSADSYFAPYKNHRAVILAKEYSQKNIVYDAVSGYGNMLIFDKNGNIIFDPDYTEGSNSSFDRWSRQQKNDMLVAINDFYKVSKFHDWFVSTEAYQKAAIESFKSICIVDYSWFDSFYGKNDKIASRIILSFMIGGGSNGISLRRADGTFLLTPTLGSLYPNGTSVRFSGDMHTVIHEFSHPYCNPLIYKYWSSISETSERVFLTVSEIMKSQAYVNASSMMCETLVRSCTIHYLKTHDKNYNEYSRFAFEESNGFKMVRSVVKTLEKYEQNKDQYPMLDSFMPEIIATINAFEDTTPDGGQEEEDNAETVPWSAGQKLDAEHDIAAIRWGGDWHIPSVEEWNLLTDQCDFERKEANENMYGVAGYFFYNKSDHSKFIFLPISSWNNELRYWTSETADPYMGASSARTFRSIEGRVGAFGSAGIDSQGFAVRPVILTAGPVNANGHDYVDLGIVSPDGKKLYFATMNVGEISVGGLLSCVYRWGATKEWGPAWHCPAK